MHDVGEEGWVLFEDYERAVAFFKGFKEEALAGAQSAEEREEIMAHLALGRHGRGYVYVTTRARYFVLLCPAAARLPDVSIRVARVV